MKVQITFDMERRITRTGTPNKGTVTVINGNEPDGQSDAAKKIVQLLKKGFITDVWVKMHTITHANQSHVLFHSTGVNGLYFATQEIENLKKAKSLTADILEIEDNWPQWISLELVNIVWEN